MGVIGRDEQKRQIEVLEDTYGGGLELRAKYYAVFDAWYRAWMEYVEGNGADPGIIDNENLVDEQGGLKEDGVFEGKDYILKHERIWAQLKDWYGANHEICGTVERNSKGELYVDIYPVRFEVYVVNTKTNNGKPHLLDEEQNSSLIVPRSRKMGEIVEFVADFLGQPVDSLREDTCRLWVCQGPISEFHLIRDDVMEDEIRDVLTGLGKWKLLVETRENDDLPWPHDGNATETEKPDITLLRRRASSFVREAPEVGHRVDAKREKDGKWHEAIIINVDDRGDPDKDDDHDHDNDDMVDIADEIVKGRYFVTVHYLSFDAKEDALFDVCDEKNLQPAYTRVPDWRAQLRSGEEVEVHRKILNSSNGSNSNATAKGIWLIGKVKKFNRATSVAPPPPAPTTTTNGESPEEQQDDNDMDLDEDPDVDGERGGSPSPSNAQTNGTTKSPKRKKTTNLFSFRRNKDEQQQQPVGRQVLVSVKTGSYVYQRKDVWVDLDSEDIAQLGTHTATKQAKSGYGPQGTLSRPVENGVVGLRNLGNTCFMNSMLQCLSFTSPLSDYFIRGEYEVDINRKNPLGTGGKLAESYAALIADIWSEKYSTIAPVDFKQQLGRAFSQFQGYQQQDSHELFSLLLDGLHEDLNRVRKKPYTEAVEANGRPDDVVAKESWDVFRMRNDSVVVDEMMGLLRSHLTCPKCQKEAVKFDAYSSWSVPIPQIKTKPVNVVLYTRGVPQGKRQAPTPTLVRFVCDAPRDGRFIDVAKWLSERTSIPIDELCLIQVRDNKRQAGGFAYNPHDEQQRKGYQHSFDNIKNWEEKDDMIAYELGPLRSSAEEGGECEDPTDGEDSKMDDDDEEDEKYTFYNSSSDKKNKKRNQPEVNIVEIRFLTKATEYHSFRLADHCRIVGKVTNKEVHQMVWERVRFMFKESYIPPNSFLDEFDAPDTYYQNDGEPVSSSNKMGEAATETDHANLVNELADAPYMLNGGYYGKLAVDDDVWKPLDHLDVVFTKTGLEALRYKPSNDKSFGYRKTVEEKNESYALGTVEMDETAAKVFNSKNQNGKQNVNLYQCMEKFGQREQLGENDEWFCPNCKDLVQAFKVMELWSVPTILCIHLKRFYYERSRYVRSWIDREKISCVVDFPLNGLKLGKYVKSVKPGDPEPIYDLYAVSNHIGGMGGGHYTAYVKHQESQKWYLMDDSRTSEASEDDIVSQQAYVLFYKLREKN